MSGRIEKSKSAKTRARLALADHIAESGETTEMPCTRCFRQNLACVMHEDSSRCSECVRVGRSCDGTFVASTLTKLLSQQKKIEAEEAEAEEALFILQTQMSTALNRLARLRRMKKVAKEKSSEAFRRGMQELDSEDRIAPAESIARQEEYCRDELLQATGVAVDDFDWSSVGLDPSVFRGADGREYSEPVVPSSGPW